MIKLIASDMDGTLLNGDRKIDDKFFQIIDALRSNGIYIVFASGREYNSLTKLVPKKYYNDIIFACNNGNYIEFNGQVLFEKHIDKSYLTELMKILSSLKKIRVIACTSKKVYTNSLKNLIIARLKGHNCKFRRNFLSIDENIIKITIFNEDENQNEVLESLYSLTDFLEITPSGKKTIDITCKGVHKGIAIKFLQEKFNIHSSQTMAFGDYLNDIEMLKVAEYSFAMKNAHPEVFDYANFVADYHYNEGVINEIINHAM